MKARLNRRLLSNSVLLFALVLLVPACIKRAQNAQLLSYQQANELQSGPIESSLPVLQTRININTASANELETLPGIGKSLAERIIAHREKYGPFRRPEHLIIVRGISDKRFRALRDLVTVELIRLD
jgi:competence protein ComEA